MIEGNDLLEPFTFDEAIGLHQLCEKLGILVTKDGKNDVFFGALRMRPKNVEPGPSDMVFTSVKEALIFAKGLDASTRTGWVSLLHTGKPRESLRKTP